MFEQLKNDDLLIKLKKYFKDAEQILCVVGGKVREAIMGYSCNREIGDIDLCGNISLSSIVLFCDKNNLNYEVRNKDLEIVKIFCGNKEYEYARFRKESYDNEYSHTPKSVEFTDDYRNDCLRRDYTINAIYYNILTGEMLDPLGGVLDIKNKMVKQCVRGGHNSLKYDPARIIRMVELASRLNFNIDKETLVNAKAVAKNVYKLSEYRLKKEMSRLLEKNKYGEDYSKYLLRVESLLKELGIEDILTK